MLSSQCPRSSAVGDCRGGLQPPACFKQQCGLLRWSTVGLCAAYATSRVGNVGWCQWRLHAHNTVLMQMLCLFLLFVAAVQLCLEYMVNHISPASPQFQDYIQHGEASRFSDMFVKWRDIWPDGERTRESRWWPCHADNHRKAMASHFESQAISRNLLHPALFSVCSRNRVYHSHHASAAT